MNTSQMLRESWSGWMSQSTEPRGPAWLQFVWTGLFSMAVAVAFTILGFGVFASGDGAWRNPWGWLEWYLRYLAVGLSIGFSIHLLFNLGRRVIGVQRIRRFRAWQRMVYFTAIPMSGTTIGLTIGLTLQDVSVRGVAMNAAPNSLVGSLLFGLLVMFLFQVYFSARHQRLAAERRATEAQLKLLQGQIEPHFLFNTLANVVGLMDYDTPRAKLMLESFVDYLRSSLGSLRTEGHTLGHEIDLVEAYLRIIQIRMDDRLHYAIDVPDDLRATALPALSLQPLVENAIQHGLEPQIAGGSVRITARLAPGAEGRGAGEALVVTVEDDGLGLPSSATHAVGWPKPGSSTALNNTRERLSQAFGSAASLQIESLVPHGVRARLTLPAMPATHTTATP